ncbi:MAG: M16 family metallopeptidase [Archangium sp.]
MLRQTLLVAGMVLLAATAPAAPKPDAPVRTKTLKNGMKVIVWSDMDNPSVALFDWFHVGSRNERPGITGLSHFFEHMMFNGAKKYGPGEFDRVMEAHGGRNDAYTSEDVTVYQDWFPRSALETIFDLEADRLAHLAIDPKRVESERGVVYSERRSSVDNDNNGLLMEQVQATAFVAHPYQIPVIGWPSDIEGWTQEDLERYFRTYYAPNNATLIVVGAVKAEEVFALAEKYLEPIAAQPAPEPVRTQEPAQPGERRVVVRKLAQAPLLDMAFHGFKASDPEAPALEVLLRILTDGDSSRLHRRLVEETQVAIQVTGFRAAGFDPGLTWLLVELPPGGDLGKAEALLDEELGKVVVAGVTDAELSKAKNILVADFWRNLETNSGRAQALGTYEVFHGDWRKLFSAPERYEAVTREQVQKVAAKVFSRNNRTVGVLVPESAGEAKKEAAR